MISNQVLQKTLDEVRSITEKDMAVFDTDGHMSAKTDRNLEIDEAKISAFLESNREYREIADCQLFKIKEENQVEYVLAVKGSSAGTELVGRMVKYQIEKILSDYREKFDKDNFIKSLLADNLLLVDIFDRSRRLHIELKADRVVYLIRFTEKNQDDAIGTLKSMFPDNEDFVTAIGQKRIIVVKQLSQQVAEEEADSIAQMILSSLHGSIGEEPFISYGTVVGDLKEVSKSYKESQMAMDVGDIFFPKRKINPYANLGIGRLIYQLPMPLCKLFIHEIFKEISPLDLDEETIETINKFFENSLNVSETSRQLFIHRNTLVYRLDKIQKMTGLDLRVFDEAITFKIALMVARYMQYVDGLDYK